MIMVDVFFDLDQFISLDNIWIINFSLTNQNSFLSTQTRYKGGREQKFVQLSRHQPNAQDCIMKAKEEIIKKKRSTKFAEKKTIKNINLNYTFYVKIKYSTRSLL